MKKNDTMVQELEGKKRRFAPAKAPMGGPGRGPGPRGGMPGMKKPKVKNAKGTIVRLFGYMSAVKVELIVAILALLGSTTASLITPKISGNIIDLLKQTASLGEMAFMGITMGAYVTTGLILNSTARRDNRVSLLSLGTQGTIFSLTALVAGKLSADTEAVAETAATGSLGQLLTVMGVLYIFGTLCSLAQQLLLVKVAQHTVRHLRTDLFDKLQGLPLRFFDANPHGDVMSRLTNDVDNVSNMLSNTITQVLSSIITLVMCLYMMITLSWQLTLVAFLTIPLQVFIAKTITSRTGKYFKLQQACLGELNGIVEETVTGARVVKVFCREDNVIKEFDEANEDLTRAGITANILSSVMGPMMNVVNNIAYALMSGIGGIIVVANPSVSIGMIQSFLQYERQFANPFTQIANQVTTIQSALAGAERVFEIMDTAPEPADAPNADDFASPKGHVEFRDVTFGYNPERPILKHLTFEAKPGQTIALVGPTGAGKTTVVNLLMRFYDIDSGELLLDGRSIRDIKRQNLRTSMGMVLQDVYLFAGTVRENIIYGKQDATEEEIRRAIRMANCEEFIDRLPEGLDTMLTESGANISQGQRQLLSIARAILADPAVLILDEATSSVDTRTEMHIQQAMLTLMKGRTSFVIAHRLSTIRNADQILVLNAGEIIERGTHEELVALGGFYAGLLNSQYKSGVLEEDDT